MSSATRSDRRRESLLKDDFIAIRCDVCHGAEDRVHWGEVQQQRLLQRQQQRWLLPLQSSDYDCKRLRRKKRARRPEPDDKEFVKRCLRAPRENRSTDNRDASAIHTS
jgi:hypothetical protein